MAFLACVHLALFLALSLSPRISLVSSLCDHCIVRDPHTVAGCRRCVCSSGWVKDRREVYRDPRFTYLLTYLPGRGTGITAAGIAASQNGGGRDGLCVYRSSVRTGEARCTDVQV